MYPVEGAGVIRFGRSRRHRRRRDVLIIVRAIRTLRQIEDLLQIGYVHLRRRFPHGIH